MPNIAELLTLGTRYHQAGELAQAESIYGQILQIEPDHAQALHQLGALAVTRGMTQRGIELIERAIRSDGSHASFYVSLGEGFRQLGDLNRAVRANEQALEIEPSLGSAHANLGLFRQQQGDLPQAVCHFQEFLRLAPNDLNAHALLGRALLQQGNLDGAQHCFRSAIRIAPRDARAHYNLGVVLQAQRKMDEAVDCYRAAIANKPDDASAHNNLGTILQHFGALVDAERHYRIALSGDPNFADARSNLAATLIERYHHEKALVHARRAVELREDFAAAHHNLALALQGLGRLDEAVAHHRRAIELAPGESTFHSALVYLLNFLPDYGAAAVAVEHRAWAARHADPLTAQSAPHANDRTIDRRLRIGYVSPYFASHAVNFFTEPILTNHERGEFEVYCYSDVRSGDETTHRLRDSVEHWRETSSLDDQQLSQAVRDDGIDILVDLTGHISGNRLLAFARKPAPIQVTYIGYQNTTGMIAMDYRLTDAYCDPPGRTEALHTEQLVRLSRTFFCYRPSPDAPEVDSLPALRTGRVTYGAFNDFTKVTPQVLDAWAQILGKVPQARLVLLADEGPSLHRHICEIFESQHVGSARIEVVERVPRAEYLARIGQVDIALDPFPFNGHTTTCDCLWQGVPVVTLSGETYASRFGGSGLATVGLEDLIARTLDQYVAIAAGLATDLDRLAELRRTLRERMAASPLLDHRAFTRNLEAEYRRMWAAWCNS